MTESEIKKLVERTLSEIAPDIEGQPIEPGETFREQFDMDAMDFLRFVTALHKTTGIDIAEEDYPKLQTLAGCIAYFSRR